MTQGVRYATGEGGARIAWSQLGEGPPLVVIGQPAFHNAVSAATDPLVVALSHRFRTIWFDVRGTGYSARTTDHFDLATLAGDIAAVAEAAGLDRLAVCGRMDGAPMAVKFASTFPESVSHLILLDPWAEASSWATEPVERLWAGLRHDWPLLSEAIVRVALGLAGAQAEAVASAFRSNVSAEAFHAYWIETHNWDVRPLLPGLRTSTIVFHWAGADDNARAVAADIAARIPDARLDSFTALFGGSELCERLWEFCGGQTQLPTRDASPPAHLTPRELEVLGLLAGGRSNRQIAIDLVVSERTVVRHVANIYDKIDAHGRADATAYAYRHGLV